MEFIGCCNDMMLKKWSAIIILIAAISLSGCVGQIEETLDELEAEILESSSTSGLVVESEAVGSESGESQVDLRTLENRIHELINEIRSQNGLSPLAYDPELAYVARGHSQDMIDNGFIDHINLNGEDPTARGLKAGYECHKDYGSYYTEGIAENIFQNNLYDSVSYYGGTSSYNWNTADEIAQSTVDGWMNSPGHRGNILTLSYGTEGIGVAIASDKKVLITQNFC